MFEKLRKIKHRSAVTVVVTAVFIILAYKIIMNIESIAMGVKNAFFVVADLVMPFIIGGLMAYLLYPAVAFFERKLFSKCKKIKKTKTVLSLIIVYIIVAATLVLILNNLIPLLVTSIKDIASHVPEYFNKLMEFRNGDWNHSVVGKIVFDAFVSVENEIKEFASSYKLTSLNPAITGIVGGVASATGTVIDVVFGIIISVYFILEKENLIRGLKRVCRFFCKGDKVDMLGSYAMEAHRIFSRFIVGKTLDSLIIGVIAFIAFLIMRVDNATLYSVIIGVTNLIPYFGPFIGGIPVVLLVLFDSPLQALWVGLFIFALQQADGMIIGPKIIGDSVDLSPFWIIFATVVGGGLFGVLGMFFGTPVLAVIFLFVNRALDKKIQKENV